MMKYATSGADASLEAVDVPHQHLYLLYQDTAVVLVAMMVIMMVVMAMVAVMMMMTRGRSTSIAR